MYSLFDTAHPIYTAIHCELDFCWELIEVVLDGPTSAIVGQPVSFTATPVIGNMYDENHQCGLQHRFSVNDQIIEYNGHGLFNYTFGNAGSNKVEVRSNCQNCATWNFQSDTIYISAEPSAPTGVEIITFPAAHYINAYVEMPTMIFAAQAQPSNLPLSYLTFHWYLTIDHSQNGRTTTQVRIPANGTTDITGNNTWVPDWGNIVAGGSNITVYVKVSNNQGSSPIVGKSGFRILGENPTASQIATETSTTPWFIDRLIKQESTNRQFSNTTGLPLNNGNGFGLMQVDNPVPSDRALWDWKRNITEGQAIVAAKRALAKDFWDRQVLQFNTYNATNPTNQVAVHQDIVVSDKTFSHSPTGNQKSFQDGIWIKAYNGASSGHWLTWNNTDPNKTPYWQHNELNVLDKNYVLLVCSQRP